MMRLALAFALYLCTTVVVAAQSPVVLGAWNGPTLPTNPSVGMLVYNTSTNALVVWNGTAWVTGLGAGTYLPLSGGTVAGLQFSHGTITTPALALTLNAGNATGTLTDTTAYNIFQSFPTLLTAAGATLTPLDYSFNDFQINVNGHNTTGTIMSGVGVQMNLAPNANESASGGFLALGATLSTGPYGAVSCTGCIYSAAVFNFYNETNTGGTATLSANAASVLNVVCDEFALGTYSQGCSGIETDLVNATSSDSLTGQLLVDLGSTVEPRLGPMKGFQISASIANPIGFDQAFIIGNQHSYFPMTAFWGIGLYAQPTVHSPTPAMGELIDANGITMHGCTIRVGFTAQCAMQAQGITSATLLTTDGSGSAKGYISGSLVTAGGSGYVAYPTAAVTGCTGAVLNPEIGSGTGVASLGIYTNCTNAKAESTVSITPNGSGSGATAVLTIAGNSLNLPIKSTNTITCTLSEADSGPGNIGATITFVATMGNNALSTAIVGSPTWSYIGTNSNFVLSAPTANQTLGAINITATPSGGVTANVGGSCTINSSAQTI